MLYEAIILGSEIYRSCGYGSKYDDALKKQCSWANPNKPTLEEVKDLKRFVNRWSSHMQAKPEEIQSALHKILPDLNCLLRGKNILTVDLDDPCTSGLICRSFEKLATCNTEGRYEAVGASKILHVIFPKFFVMWDRAIARGYDYHRQQWPPYTDFLQRMQWLAKCAVGQVMRECRCSCEEAIKRLTRDGRSLAKTLDEYNFIKFTKNDDRVWKKECKL